MTNRLPGVLLLYNKPRERSETEGYGSESDEGVLVEVQEVAGALRKLGCVFRTVALSRMEDLPGVLALSPEPVVFNLVEDMSGSSLSATVIPAACEAFGKAVTGCDTSCLALALDKWRAKSVFRGAGLPVPEGIVVPVGQKPRLDAFADGPVIVKPVSRDASEGLDASSVLKGASRHVEEAVEKIHRLFCQPALVEQYVGTREFNISLLQRGNEISILPLAEIDFSAFEPDRLRIVDYAAKWLPDTFQYRHTTRIIPAPVDASLAGRIRGISLQAWHALGCRDYVRVDLRTDESGKVFVLEANPNPDLSPDCGYAAALTAAGIPFHEFVAAVVGNAAERLGILPSVASPQAQVAGSASGPVIRRTVPADRDEILRLTEATSFFRPCELTVAREVLDEALAKGPEGDYQSYTADVDGKPVGWVCFGATPCTVGTYDVYWIVVAPECQGKGVGAALMRYAEKAMIGRGARQAIIETSGGDMYKRTQGFYARLGYVEHARVRDFYAPGDDRIICVKKLG